MRKTFLFFFCVNLLDCFILLIGCRCGFCWSCWRWRGCCSSLRASFGSLGVDRPLEFLWGRLFIRGIVLFEGIRRCRELRSVLRCRTVDDFWVHLWVFVEVVIWSRGSSCRAVRPWVLFVLVCSWGVWAGCEGRLLGYFVLQLFFYDIGCWIWRLLPLLLLFCMCFESDTGSTVLFLLLRSYLQCNVKFHLMVEVDRSIRTLWGNRVRRFRGGGWWWCGLGFVWDLFWRGSCEAFIVCWLKPYVSDIEWIWYKTYGNHYQSCWFL